MRELLLKEKAREQESKRHSGYISTEGGFGWLWVALANAMTFGESMFFEGHRKHRLYKLAREIYGVLCWLLKNNA